MFNYLLRNTLGNYIHFFQLVSIYNGRRKVSRLADEVKELGKHGVMVKPELQGLLQEQIKGGNIHKLIVTHQKVNQLNLQC